MLGLSKTHPSNNWAIRASKLRNQLNVHRNNEHIIYIQLNPLKFASVEKLWQILFWNSWFAWKTKSQWMNHIIHKTKLSRDHSSVARKQYTLKSIRSFHDQTFNFIFIFFKIKTTHVDHMSMKTKFTPINAIT